MVRFKIHLSVGVNPERNGSPDFDAGRPIVEYLREKIMLSEKGGWQSQQDDRFGKISDKA